MPSPIRPATAVPTRPDPTVTSGQAPSVPSRPDPSAPTRQDPSPAHRPRRRWGRGTAVLLACATVAVATTGCGASAGGGTGDATTYARAYDRACRSMVDGLESVTEEVGSAEDTAMIDPEGTTATLKSGMQRIFDAVDDGFEAMSSARAPKKWSAFQDEIRSATPEFRKAVAEGRDVVDDVDELSDFAEVETKLAALGFDDDDDESGDDDQGGPGDFPADLLRAAPSCQDLKDL